MSSSERREQHRWLDKLVGTWKFEVEAGSGPDQPPEKYTGTEQVRSLGGLWVVCEGQGSSPGGGSSTSLMTIGFDDEKDRFVGTFVASMMSKLWLYEGELDPTGKVLTLNSEGPSPTGDGKSTQYKDVMTLESDDHRVFTSSFLDAEGQWRPFMKMQYRRK